MLGAKVTGAPSGISPGGEDVSSCKCADRASWRRSWSGAALAVAGTAFQGLFRNPLVSPDILGASSGAALGAVLGIFFRSACS